MNKLIDKIKDALPVHDSLDSAVLYLNGNIKGYDLITFETEFEQEFDHWGEPQHEIKGGLLVFTLRQSVDECLNKWMFGTDVAYDGIIKIGPTNRIGSAPILITFVKGRCIDYGKKIMKHGFGLQLRMVISAGMITINDVKHRNDPKFVTESA